VPSSLIKEMVGSVDPNNRILRLVCLERGIKIEWKERKAKGGREEGRKGGREEGRKGGREEGRKGGRGREEGREPRRGWCTWLRLQDFIANRNLIVCMHETVHHLVAVSLPLIYGEEEFNEGRG
jgi:hypothetical protein